MTIVEYTLNEYPSLNMNDNSREIKNSPDPFHPYKIYCGFEVDSEGDDAETINLSVKKNTENDSGEESTPYTTFHEMTHDDMVPVYRQNRLVVHRLRCVLRHFLGHQPITLPVYPKMGQVPMDKQPVFTVQ